VCGAVPKHKTEGGGADNSEVGESNSLLSISSNQETNQEGLQENPHFQVLLALELEKDSLSTVELN